MRHIIYYPHRRLAARQPNDIISIPAGPLKCRLARLNLHSSPNWLYNWLYKWLQSVNTVSQFLFISNMQRELTDSDISS